MYTNDAKEIISYYGKVQTDMANLLDKLITHHTLFDGGNPVFIGNERLELAKAQMREIIHDMFDVDVSNALNSAGDEDE